MIFFVVPAIRFPGLSIQATTHEIQRRIPVSFAPRKRLDKLFGLPEGSSRYSVLEPGREAVTLQALVGKAITERNPPLTERGQISLGSHLLIGKIKTKNHSQGTGL